MGLPAANNARLVARIPQQVRRTIQAAADLQGASLNQFIVQAAHEHAQQVLEREALVKLSRQQTKRVFELIDRPPRPNRAVFAARAAHRKLVRA
jgi:uncharacterized protein (DUF1778 family)